MAWRRLDNHRGSTMPAFVPPSIDYSWCLPGELLNMRQAAERLDRQAMATRRTCTRYAINGFCLGAMVVHRVAIRLLMEKRMQALDAFRRGDFTHPEIVKAYLDEGLTPPTATAAA